MTTEARATRLAPTVAVLIMAISLLGAMFAYLDSQAGNRSASSARRAEGFGVQVLAESGVGEREIGQELLVFGYGNDAGWISLGLGGIPGSGWTGAMAAAYDALRAEAATFSKLVDGAYQLPDGSVDWLRFVEESRRPIYRALELQKAHSEVTEAWGSKSGKYVAILTMLAAALFLLGLTVSVVRESQLPLVVAGVGLATVAGLWGLSVVLAPVPEVSEPAVDAYVDGLLTSFVSQDPDDLLYAEDRFGDAIAASPRYREAYVGRAHVRFTLDLLDAEGPQGSDAAVADLEVALRLNPRDAVAWNNLGAAWFWLDRYEEAGTAWERALEFDPDEPIVNLNRALLMGITQDPGYEAQLDVVRGLLVEMPAWQRDAVVGAVLDVLLVAETYRPDISLTADRMHAALFQMDRQIAVGRRFFGTPEPPPITASMAAPDLALSADGTVLRVDFSYTGMETGQRFIYRTFVDGVEAEQLSLAEAAPWTLEVPDGLAFVEITHPAGFRGHTVRVELYVEGNLLAIGELSS